jgi:DNA polymerase I-like protein with 3'-5' exonuclease and polymerase domains
MLISLDIETACNVGCETKCDHALDEYRNRITVIGVFYEREGVPTARTFRDLGSFRAFLSGLGEFHFVGHNLKFDLKNLSSRGIHLENHWEDDTLLMAATLTQKIPSEWLAWYETRRAEENEKLPRGYSHRPGSAHSLKCLAPYFLNVQPFWEDPTNHDNDEYVLQDCYYTHELSKLLTRLLKEEGSYEFYKKKLLPWTHLLLAAERRGVMLDLSALTESERIASEAALQAKIQLDERWAEAYDAYYKLQENELRDKYGQKTAVALEKAKDKKKTRARYVRLFEAAKAKLDKQINLDSPSQLSWLLRDYFKLNITDFHGDETTGKSTLQRLGAERDDIRLFLEYRKQQKLATAFFPSYREMHHESILHCSFNPTGTRTGRLSSSSPNLQQVPGHLHKLFRARPGYRIATYDMSAIEPRVIAYYTQDLNLIDILSTGQDFHGYNTRIFFDLDCDVKDVKERYPNERKLGKEVGLALFYGAGSGRLEESAQRHGFRWSRRECQRKLERFKEAYEGVYNFREILNTTLLTEPVTNLLGRRFAIDDPTDIHMKGLNTLIQSSASDLVLESAQRITKEFENKGIDGHVLLLVHDEIVTEIPATREAECVEIITRCMTDYKLPTPLGDIKLMVEGKVAEVWTK